MSQSLSQGVDEKVAMVFPGQGSQYVGMGKDLYDGCQAARHIFEQADDLLGFALSRLCFEGPEDELTDTFNAQPAILTTSAALLTALKEQVGDKLAPAFVAGHSLGEYTALLAAGVLDFAAVLGVVRERGRLMKEAGQKQPGAMAAVLGSKVELLQSICEEVGNVWVANRNSPGQIVLSGGKSALALALQVAAERGVRKSIVLPVSIASHSPLMASAAEAFAPIIERLHLVKASVPVVVNVTASPEVEPSRLRGELVQQLTSPVRWVESVQYMIARHTRLFVEVGPQNLLSRLINQIDRGVQTLSLGNMASIEALKV